MELEIVCQKSRILVEEVGQYLREEKSKAASITIEEKDRNQLVSYVDRTAEEKLVKGLSEILPGSTFLTEEATVEQKESDLRWIIDPLDGTTNFLHQLPIFSISVALQQKGQTVLGIVYEVNQKECFYAWKDAGAYLNGNSIHVSQNSKLENSLLGTGFPYHDYRRAQQYLVVFEHFFRETRGLRRMGSAAVDLAYVACGRFDAFFEYGISPWDVAAGNFLVQEAGGIVTDFQGGEKYHSGQELIASSTNLYPEMRKVIEAGFYPE